MRELIEKAMGGTNIGGTQAKAMCKYLLEQGYYPCFIGEWLVEEGTYLAMDGDVYACWTGSWVLQDGMRYVRDTYASVRFYKPGYMRWATETLRKALLEMKGETV